MASHASKPGLPTTQRRILRAVASVELFKGIFVLILGVIAILLLHKDSWVIAESILALFHISTDRRSAQLFLDYADDLTDARLWMLARLAFAYSVLRFVEAYGLWKQRTWAEWVALGSGTLLIPWEIRELLRGVTLLRSGVFIGNLIIVFYMLYLLRCGRLTAMGTAAAPKEAAASEGSRASKG
ncbi:MAG TPA: DUF2127 domain-containing protein [Candidatus Sulfotelmatobacter sp.]